MYNIDVGDIALQFYNSVKEVCKIHRLVSKT